MDPFSPREQQGSQQVETFKNWLNYWLRLGGNEGIQDLRKDFEDGIKLIQLVEALTGEKVRKKPNFPAKLNHQKLDNINIALDHLRANFLSQLGVSDVGWVLPSANNIFEGDYKLILGFIWILIQYTFQLRSKNSTSDNKNDSSKSTKENCVDWLKKYLVEYAPNLTSFPSCMKDGRIFCYLIHKQDPNLIDLALMESKQASERLKEAFDLADKHFGIPTLLTPEMVLYNVDEMSILTYLSTWIAHIEYGVQKKRDEEERLKKIKAEEERVVKKEKERSILQACLFAWVNARVQASGEKLTKASDLLTTNILFSLAELSARKRIELPKEANEISKEEKVLLAIDHLTKNGVKIPIDKEQILAGHEASIFGLVWCIFQRFKAKFPANPANPTTTTPASNSTPSLPLTASTNSNVAAVLPSWDNEPLFKWFQDQVTEVDLKNFPTCVTDGLAFCHFLSKKNSGGINMKEMQNASPRDRLTAAFSGLKSLGIPPLISLELLLGQDIAASWQLKEEILIYLKFLKAFL